MKRIVSIPQRVQPWPRHRAMPIKTKKNFEFPSLKGFNRGPDLARSEVKGGLLQFPSLKGFNRGPDRLADRSPRGGLGVSIPQRVQPWPRLPAPTPTGLTGGNGFHPSKGSTVAQT